MEHATQIVERWIAEQFQRFEEQKANRRYRMCCYTLANDTLTEGDPILDYNMGLALCEPLGPAFPGQYHWLEPIL